MRSALASCVAVCVAAGLAAAQPAPKIAPPALPDPSWRPTPVTVVDSGPSTEFGTGACPPTLIDPAPGVRPPMPVTGAPVEVPPGPMFWAEAEYLYWRAKGGLVPPLVVGVYSSANPPLPSDPRTAFPVSDDRINGDVKQGYRLRGGIWLDKPTGTGIEAVYTAFLNTDMVNTFLGNPPVILARPFVDVDQRVPSLLSLSNTLGTQHGIAQVRTTFHSDGAELNLLRRGPAMIGEEMHWVMGVRYWSLEESLLVDAASQSSAVTVSQFDSFTTRNRFYGPQFGGNWHWDRNRLSIDLSMRLAVGAVDQQTSIDGASTAVLPGGARFDRPGGFLALRSNMGDYQRWRLATLQDMGLGLGYRITDNVQLRLGYEFVRVSSVLRPGQQIDLGVNPTLLPFNAGPVSGPIRPWYQPNGEIFWMHGVNVGLAVQF